MKKLLILVVVLLLASCNIGKTNIKEEGEIITKDYTFDNVSELNVEDIYLNQVGTYFGPNVHILDGEEYKISVVANENINSKIIVNKDGNIINIHGNRYETYSTKKVDIYIYKYSFTSIKLSNVNATIEGNRLTNDNLTIDLSGASKLSADTINCNAIKINISGASSLVVTSFIVNEMKANISGASSIIAFGTSRTNYINISGASSLNCVDLEMKTASVVISGASKAYIKFTDSLEGNLSGASTLTYYGDINNVKIDVSGASSVIRG